jgi:hypothetical protein
MINFTYVKHYRRSQRILKNINSTDTVMAYVTPYSILELIFLRCRIPYQKNHLTEVLKFKDYIWVH